MQNAIGSREGRRGPRLGAVVGMPIGAVPAAKVVIVALGVDMVP